jgi:hypothetical protein
MEALLLFKKDLGTYIRVYEFLGQKFDYGNTAYEKLYQFAKMLLPLLDYGRERERIDLSALKLTHHKMRDLGQLKLNLEGQNAPVIPLIPVTECGSDRCRTSTSCGWRRSSRQSAICRGRCDRGRCCRLCGRGAEDQTTGVRHAPGSGSGQHQGAVRQLPSLQDEIMKAIMDAMAAHK